MRERHNEPENNLPSHVKLLISCTAIVFTLFCFILFQDLVVEYLVEWKLYTDRQPLDSTLSNYLVREYRDMRMSFGRREGEFNKIQLLYMYLDHSVLLCYCTLNCM